MNGIDHDLALIIGPIASSQAIELADLHAEAFNAPWKTSTLSELLAQAGVFAVSHRDGFILCRTVVDEAEILTVAVRPEARRGGLGRRLVEAAAGFARQSGAARLFLEVAEDNPAARALYARCGFVAEGRRRGYYARPGGPSVDALLLSINLI